MYQRRLRERWARIFHSPVAFRNPPRPNRVVHRSKATPKTKSKAARQAYSTCPWFYSCLPEHNKETMTTRREQKPIKKWVWLYNNARQFSAVVSLSYPLNQTATPAPTPFLSTRRERHPIGWWWWKTTLYDRWLNLIPFCGIAVVVYPYVLSCVYQSKDHSSLYCCTAHLQSTMQFIAEQSRISFA